MSTGSAASGACVAGCSVIAEVELEVAEAAEVDVVVGAVVVVVGAVVVVVDVVVGAVVVGDVVVVVEVVVVLVDVGPVVVVGDAGRNPTTCTATASISPGDRTPENAGMDPAPLAICSTTAAIGSTLSTRDGPISPSPLSP